MSRKPRDPDQKVPFNVWAAPANKDLLVKRWEVLSVINVRLDQERRLVQANRWHRRLARYLKEKLTWKRSSPSQPASASAPSSAPPLSVIGTSPHSNSSKP